MQALILYSNVLYALFTTQAGSIFVINGATILQTKNKIMDDMQFCFCYKIFPYEIHILDILNKCIFPVCYEMWI